MPSYQRGFSVIELLITAIVIAITVIFLISLLQNVNMRSRDAVRLTDITNLSQAIQTTIQNNESTEKLFFILCSQVKTPCDGNSYPVTEATQKIDGSGWLKISFNNKDILRYSFLPLDPLNNEQYYYKYTSDGKSWKLETKFESNNFKDRMKDDHGTDPNKYEITQKLKF